MRSGRGQGIAHDSEPQRGIDQAPFANATPMKYFMASIAGRHEG
jgi:hypothetical protein